MAEKTIVLGISGGIAAYKTPELVRSLIRVGYRVIPVMTRAAEEFVTETTLAAVSGETVRRDLWDTTAERAMGHIELARSADLLLIAPATTHVIGKLAHGLADDLLSTIYAANTAPVLVAPAMNNQMFLHGPTQRNLKQLKDDGVHIVGPEDGEQACGEFGPGRMSEPEQITIAVNNLLYREVPENPEESTMADSMKVLVTAGPTREAIDPVRFLSNASSGRQGFAIAQAAQQIGCEVTLVSGPVALESPQGVQRIDVQSAAEMREAVLANVADCDVMFAVAAVADYRPRSVKEQKIKKSLQKETRLSLELVETEDVVSAVASLSKRPYLVGFAAETDNVLANAREKRVRKNLDAIVLNDVSKEEIGFDSLHNAVTLIHDSGEVDIPHATKLSVAHEILREIAQLVAASKSNNTANGTTS